MGTNTAYESIRRGDFPVLVRKIGRRMKVLRSDLDAYLRIPRPLGFPATSTTGLIEQHIADLRAAADQLERWLRGEGPDPEGLRGGPVLPLGSGEGPDQ